MSMVSHGEMIFIRESRRTLKKPVQLPLCPQIPHGVTQARTRDFMVRGQRLTVWAKARPLVVSQRNNVHPLQPIFRCVRPTRTTARMHATGTRGDLLACGYRQFYQYWREPLEPWLRLTALLWLGLGLVKPSTFTEAHETTSEKREAPHESILYFY
jgi:hypothetical protein